MAKYKPVMAEIRTREELLALGFRDDGYLKIYKGDYKRPEAWIRRHIIENLGNKKVEVIKCNDVNRGYFTVRLGGTRYDVDVWLFRKPLEIANLTKPIKCTIGSRSAIYSLGVFEFPCAFSELSSKDARKIARWILKVGE